MEPVTNWFALIASAFGSFVAAVMGVAMRHAHRIQRGEPAPPWSRIFLDAPTVFVMGITGAAAGEWLTHNYAMPEMFGGVIAAALGYLGPSVVDRIAAYLEGRK